MKIISKLPMSLQRQIKNITCFVIAAQRPVKYLK